MAQSEETALPTVQRDEGQPGIYRVDLPNGPPHYVGLCLDEQEQQQVFCTCSPDEEAPSPDCPHTQAVRRYKERQQKGAHARRERGLSYAGCRSYLGEERYRVLVYEGGVAHPLDPSPSQALRNHSPDGLSWGYLGSGPAQLALAILLNYTGDEEMALRHYQAFKTAYVADWPQEGNWELTAAELEAFFLIRRAGAGMRDGKEDA